MTKNQNLTFITYCCLILLTVSACNNSPRNVPFPLQESEFSEPITEKLIFSKPQKLEWVNINQDSFQPIKSEKFDLDKIPSKPIVLGNPIQLLKPMKDSKFDLNSFKDTLFNLDAAPTKKLRYKMALLGQPKRTKSSLPRLKDGASDNLLKFGLDQGLSGTVYSDIKQDKNGIIWIASDDGLNSFDGEYCETFSLGQGLLSPWIIRILIDKQDQIWVRYQLNNGVSVINKKTGIIKHITTSEGLSSNSVRGIMEDKKGRIWITTDKGINVINPKDGTIKLLTKDHPLSGNSYGKIFQDSKERIWVSGKYIDMIDVKAGIIKHIPGYFNTIVEDKGGHIWFGVYSMGVLMLDEKAGVLKQVGKEQGLSNEIPFGGLTFDEKDRLWIPTINDGVYVFNVREQTYQHFSTANGLSNDKVTSIFADNQHQIWIGLNGGEANIYNVAGGGIHHLSSNDGLSNETSFYYGFAQDSLSRVWVSSLAKTGIDIIDEKNGTFKTITKEHGLSGNSANDLMTDSKGRVWIVGGASAVDVIDPMAGIISHIDSAQGIDRKFTTTLFEDSKGQIWLSRDGLYVINEKNKTLKRLPKSNGLRATVLSFAEDNEGQIWVTTENGLQVINEKEGTIKHLLMDGLTSIEYSDINKDNNGNIWIGTNGHGLIMANLNTGTITRFTIANGLPNDVIYSINERDGSIWVGTGKGLCVITPNSTKANPGENIAWNIKNYGKPQGFLRLDHNPRSSLAQDGKLWFGISDVLTLMDKPQYDTILPPTFISNVDIMGKPQNFLSNKLIQSSLQKTDTIWSMKEDTFYLKTNLPKIVEYLHENNITWQGITGPFNLPVQLKLPYNQNQVDFHFTGMYLDNMDKTRYRYILEGVDKSWSEITEKANAEYRNLLHGKYTFKVSSRGFNGKWSKPVEFEFEINPPWWLSIWAYIFYGLCVVALGYATNIFMRRRLLTIERERTRERELAQAKEIEKAYSDLKSTQAQLIQSEKLASLGELTAGIAHEIQNPLNFVNNFSEVSGELVAEMEEEMKEGNTDIALEIASDLKQNLEKINHHGKRASSIVKGMLEHSRTSSGEKELIDINALADEYLRLAYHGLRAKDSSFNADFKTDFDENLPKIEVIPQDIGRVLLNLINNAFYATKGVKNPLVEIKTASVENGILVSVRDNGTGMSEEVKAKIFQPFFTTKPTGEGTGLGLSLAYDIVTKGHGGTLEVESTEAEGTTFVIQLPITIA
ncbi:MAG: hypothetical protein CFE21_16585 [Bacteroidetes bacterium B1(2017)]|nr:MAG: hypothetical protein CFE21_16585 [Bacteroidetes bacterium B1(2017)]